MKAAENSAEPAAKKSKQEIMATEGETEEPKSFARRARPKTTPAREKWCAVRDVFQEVLQPHLRAFGFPIYSWEVGTLFI